MRIALVGCGKIAAHHLSALQQLGVAVPVICDLNPVAAQPWVQRFGARFVTDWRQAAAADDAQAVLVTTTSRLHRDVCLEAIAAGKAVICEKTLGETAADAQAITQAAIDHRVPLFTNYMKRFLPAVAALGQRLPQIGKVLTAHVRTHQCWGDLWTAAPPSGIAHTPAGGESGLRAAYGGGALHCAGSHMLDLVGALFGRPRRVYATVHVPQGRDYDLLASALLECEHGPVHFEALAHPNAGAGWLRDGWDEQIEIIGTQGRLHLFTTVWDHYERKSPLLVHLDDAAGTRVEHMFASESPFLLAHRAFLPLIAGRRQGELPVTLGYDVDAVIDALSRSGTTGAAAPVRYAIQKEAVHAGD